MMEVILALKMMKKYQVLRKGEVTLEEEGGAEGAEEEAEVDDRLETGRLH